MILQFADIQHPSQGGLFSVVQMFKQILGGAIVETIPLNHIGETFGDYQITVNNRGVLKSYPLPIQHQKVLNQIDPQTISLVIIHGLWRVHTTLGYQFAKSHQLPFLLVLHGMLDPYAFTYRAWQKRTWLNVIGQQIINEAATVVCATKREAEKASPYLTAAQIEFCTWGISTPDWQQQAVWRAEIRTKLGIAQQQRVLIFLGRLHRMKRPMETAKAFQKLQLSEWVMLFVGFLEVGGGVESIEQLCDGKFIRYHPPVSGLEKWKFLSAADAFVNLSHRENFGLTVAEAAAAGLPLLISDNVDIASILQQAGGADVITMGLEQSNQDLEAALSQFLKKSPAEHTQMGVKAKQAFENNFRMSQFEHYLLKIVETYQKSAL
jgi:glycosyltransferase involved in cell wall biosynthesis